MAQSAEFAVNIGPRILNHLRQGAEVLAKMPHKLASSYFERSISRTLVFHTSAPFLLREWVNEGPTRDIYIDYPPDGIRYVVVNYTERRLFPWLPILGAWGTDNIEEIKDVTIKNEMIELASSKFF